MRAAPENFANWAPIRFYWREDGPFVDWCYLGGDRFTRSFFENTISKRIADPFNLLFRHQTPIEFLGEINETLPGIAPTGFIFHMSRCGSTLAAQMLAALPQNIVISEAPPIDSILRGNPGIPYEQRIRWLRWMIGAFGQKRFDDEKHYFIKFDSWSAMRLDLVREAFPDVPWIFLYRDPVEVIVSQMRERGAQMIPGAIGLLLPGMSFADTIQMPPEEYCGRVLEKICEGFLEHAADPKGIAVNYTELPQALTGRVLEHFGVSYSPEDITKMTAAAKYDAKAPGMDFTADGKGKRDEASEIAREIASVRLNPLYEKMEAIRRGS